MEYKISCKIEGQFGKTSTVTRADKEPVGSEKIKFGEPFFLIDTDQKTDADVLKKMLKNVAAIYLHQKYGRTAEFAAAYQNELKKFNLI